MNNPTKFITAFVILLYINSFILDITLFIVVEKTHKIGIFKFSYLNQASL